MKQIQLAAQPRKEKGKGPARRMRRAGYVPAVIYSGGRPAEMLLVRRQDLEKVLRQVTGQTAFLEVLVEGQGPRMALLKDLQLDFLGKNILHADFYEISAEQEIEVEVPLEVKGESKGVAAGATLTQNIYSVTLKGKIAAIPDTLVVDISDLEAGEAIHVGDLPLPEGVSLMEDPDTVVVACFMPTAEAAVEEGEEAEAEEAVEQEPVTEE